MSNAASPSFPTLVQEFFTRHLVQQRAVSPRTVGAYRDTFSLLLAFAERRLHTLPTDLQMTDIDRDLIAAFLDHLERDRKNSVRTRNVRLAAIRSFLKFVARRDVTTLQLIEQALALPMKRFDRPLLGFLSREHMLAVLDLPGTSWVADRDRLLLALLYNTGARVSEIIGVRVREAVLGESPCLHLHGKGRKQRSVPLWATTVKAIRGWLKLNPQLAPESPLLPTRGGTPMTRANVAQRLELAVAAAAITHPELAAIRISPHTIRHTTAMHLLQSGIDVHLIALWLGHESPATTHHYIEADLAMKTRALARLEAPPGSPPRYRPPDALMRFLTAL